jgi:hypothetical protein
MKKNLLILFALTIFFQVKAQDLNEAPSLQVGLSGIKFSKGNLDPELVAEIIAEKQKEVKVKLIKNMLLNNLGVDNGLFYAYIDHTIEILTTEKNEDTRVKNLLENTINLAFVVSYADYYVGTLKQNSKEWNSFKALALSYGIDPLLFNKDKLNLKDFAKISYRSSSDGDFLPLDPGRKDEEAKKKNKMKSRTNKFVGVIIDLFAEQIRQNEQFKALGLLRTNYLQNYISMNSYLSLENDRNNKEAKDYVNQLDSLNDLLNGESNLAMKNLLLKIEVEMKTDVITPLTETEKGNLIAYESKINALTTRIVKKGFYNKIHNDEVADYVKVINDNENLFTLAILKNNKLFKIKSGGMASSEALFINEILLNYRNAKSKFELYTNALIKRDLADIIFNEVDTNLAVYVKYFGLVKSLAVKGNDWEKSIKAISNNFKCGNIDTLSKQMILQYKLASTEIKKLGKLSKEESESLTKINSFIEKLRYAELNRYEYMQTYEKEIKPSLNRLGVYSIDFMDMSKSMYSMLNCIDSSIKDDLAKVNIDLNLSFMNIFTKIDEFDKVETYSSFLNQLSDAGDVFSDEEMRKSINRIITFVRSYIKVSNDTSGKLSLNLDVEGFLYNIQKTPYNKFRPLEFHFTVGANTASFQKDLITNSGDTIRNYSFIGEKIGIKFKLWDYKYVRSFSKGETFTYKHWYNLFRSNHVTYLRTSPPKEPTISNIHLLLYGSGILYNIVNTRTTKSFNSPLVGVGVGITFFNDLDFNVSWGRPILNNKSFNDSSVPSFFNVGFDIQFIEYYNRLNQKRKSNQIQKKLAQAAK